MVVRVADNGIGIPSEMLPGVFEMFTQVKGADEQGQGGLGIGLTLVRGLVELHGGSVTAESAGPGLGTTMLVRLPLLRSEKPDSHAVSGEHPAAKTRRILLVDDNVDAAESLALLLELEGHVTRVAHSGAAAVAAAGEFDPHIILLDIGLPDISGFEVIERIRAAAGDRELPRLIALTGWGSKEDRRQTEAAGFDAHLVKPVDPSALRAVLC